MQWVYLMIILAIQCSINAQFCDKDNCDVAPKKKKGKNCRQFKKSDFKEDSPSIIYGEGRGRFGNMLLSYAMMYQLQSQLGVRTYLTKECRDLLLQFFRPEFVDIVPVLSDEFCNPKDVIASLEPYNGPFRDLLNDESYRKGKLINFYPAPVNTAVGGYRPEEHISQEQEEFQRGYVKALREKMVFKGNMKEKVNRRLRNMAKKMLKKNPEEVSYVAMHVRRTDHLRYMKDEFNHDPIDDEYFNEAMEYFREEYDNCLFVVASDDIEWCKKNVDTSKNDVYFSDTNPKFVMQDGFAYDEDTSKAAYDFALLTSCNYSIVSRGTYSMWVAILTPGEYMTEFGAIVPPIEYD